MKPKDRIVFDGMRAEYDFDYAKGVRGKYYARIKKEGTNVVLLDPPQVAPDASARRHSEPLADLPKVLISPV